MLTRNDLPEKINDCDLIPFWKTNEAWGLFSNWYPSPVDEFPTSEHAMMFAKAELFGDMETAGKIQEAKTPAEAKALGRTVKGFSQLIWDREKERIMLQILETKFTRNSMLRTILLSTGNKILVEASPLDTVWGVGLAADNQDIYYPAKWKGENLLGFYLMAVRDKLKDIKTNE